MADQKVSDLPSLNGADVDAADLLYIVDSSAGAAGSKKITIGQYQLAPVSGGTANTVVYLNGSKVESSSSALTFDGTNFATTGTSSAAKLIPTGGTATGNGMYLPAANTLAWSNNGAETMRLDSSGNLGLGVTPSAWSQGKAVEVNQVGYGLWNGGSSSYLLANTYFNSGFKYAATGVQASHYYQYQGAHVWSTAPSGTAGNAISFTQAMTLDASGNLGVGVTSPDVRLRLDAASPTRGVIQTVRGTGSTGSQIHISQDGVADWAFGQPAGTDAFAFWSGRNRSTDGSERARITSGGDLLVGTTSVPTNGASGAGSASFNGPINFKGFRSHAGTSGAFAANDFNLQWTGNPILWVDTTNVGQIATTSDYRIKENIAPIAHGAVDRVMQLNPIKFNRKDVGIFKGSDQVEEGFLAHELQAIIPSAVQGEKDALTEDGGIQPQSLTWAPLISVLTKAIQEQQVIIEDLRARVAALEAK